MHIYAMRHTSEREPNDQLRAHYFQTDGKSINYHVIAIHQAANLYYNFWNIQIE